MRIVLKASSYCFIEMTSYLPVKVTVSESQAQKIKKAVESKETVSIKLTHSDLDGDHTLFLTKTQANQIDKAKREKKGLVLRLSKAQLKHNVVSGGFLSAILPFLATAAKTVLPALLGGFAFSGASKAVDAIDRKINGQGLPKVFYVKRGDKSFKMTRLGNGLYLSPWKKSDSVSGSGVWLKPYGGSGYIDGKGFITGTSPENSPIAKIPILGSLLGWLV